MDLIISGTDLERSYNHLTHRSSPPIAAKVCTRSKWATFSWGAVHKHGAKGAASLPRQSCDKAKHWKTTKNSLHQKNHLGSCMCIEHKRATQCMSGLTIFSQECCCSVPSSNSSLPFTLASSSPPPCNTTVRKGWAWAVKPVKGILLYCLWCACLAEPPRPLCMACSLCFQVSRLSNSNYQTHHFALPEPERGSQLPILSLSFLPSMQHNSEEGLGLGNSAMEPARWIRMHCTATGVCA